MKFNCLISSLDWDAPIFKILASNDTGSAPGHQGGIVIPKDLRSFFPGLSGALSSSSPTSEHRVSAELFLGNDYLATVSTRYQLQSWGGKRSPESRLTDKLVPLRKLATGGDLLIIQRKMESFVHFRLTLIKKSDPNYKIFDDLIKGRRWGVLSDVPLTTGDFESAVIEERKIEEVPFVLIDSSASKVTTLVTKTARSLAFRVRILEIYNETCSVCGEALKSPSGLVEVDAAHVVPRSALGADEARNGFALCKRHHWAFDNGLFGVGSDRKITVPSSVKLLHNNTSLSALDGKLIREANIPELRVHPEAFAWHMEKICID